MMYCAPHHQRLLGYQISPGISFDLESYARIDRRLAVSCHPPARSNCCSIVDGWPCRGQSLRGPREVRLLCSSVRTDEVENASWRTRQDCWASIKHSEVESGVCSIIHRLSHTARTLWHNAPDRL